MPVHAVAATSWRASTQESTSSLPKNLIVSLNVGEANRTVDPMKSAVPSHVFAKFPHDHDPSAPIPTMALTPSQVPWRKFPAPCTTDSPQLRFFSTGAPQGIISPDCISASAEIPSTAGSSTPSSNPLIEFAHAAAAVVRVSTTFA